MAEPLYTLDILRLATETGRWPLLSDADFSAERRAPLCGSSLKLDLAVDAAGRISAVGMQPQSCAMGQASASLFARHALGLRAEDIIAAHDALAAWLTGASDTPPDWPEVDQLAPARAYPARHGAILLPFAAARAALAGEA